MDRLLLIPSSNANVQFMDSKYVGQVALFRISNHRLNVPLNSTIANIIVPK